MGGYIDIHWAKWCPKPALTLHDASTVSGRNAKPLAKLTDFGLCRFGTEATGEWCHGMVNGGGWR